LEAMTTSMDGGLAREESRWRRTKPASSIRPGAPGAADAFEAHEGFHGESHQDFHEEQVVGEGDAGCRRRRCDPVVFLRPMNIHLDRYLLGRSFFFFFFPRKGSFFIRELVWGLLVYIDRTSLQ
jgi:hypothetical protein